MKHVLHVRMGFPEIRHFNFEACDQWGRDQSHNAENLYLANMLYLRWGTQSFV